LNQKEIQHIINKGESETLELKTAFSKAVIETIVAFSNTKGGKVIIGVNDNKEIVGVSITEETVQKWVNEIKQNTLPQVVPDVEILNIEDKAIVIVNTIEYPVKPVGFKTRYYKRVLNSNHLMDLNETSNLHLQTINSSWDYYLDNNHGIEDISIEKVEKFISIYEDAHHTKVDYQPTEFLNKQGILRNTQLTYGAYLLFVKDYCSTSDIQIGRFKSDITIIDSLSLNTDLFSQIDQINAFIKKHLMVEFIITGEPQHIERYDYPIEAIREIVINMIVHRDYRSSNGSIIKIYDDRIEFYNPGGLFGDLTLEQLLKFNYSSQTRNKLIAQAFKEIGAIEKYGSGIKRIFSICKDYGIIAPQISIEKNGFKIILFKKKNNGGVNGGVNGGLNDKISELYDLIKASPGKRTNELAKLIEAPYKTVEKWISKLRNMGKIEFRGSSKTGGYFIV
jgi:ATP-dependent DNA helicase RecG